jgi:hypothetical protein
LASWFQSGVGVRGIGLRRVPATGEASRGRQRATRGLRRRWWLAGIGAALAIAVVGGGYATVGNRHTASGDEQAMATRAAQVMPFALDTTSHTFAKSAAGGVEMVMAKDRGDQRNITLIRQHLQKEAGQFAKGDYGDPATIHGSAMPGLKELQAGAARVQIAYEQAPSGARITYSACRPGHGRGAARLVRRANDRPRHARHGPVGPAEPSPASHSNRAV